MTMPTPRPNMRRATLVTLHPFEACQQIRPVEYFERDMVHEEMTQVPRIHWWRVGFVMLGMTLYVAFIVWSLSVIIHWALS